MSTLVGVIADTHGLMRPEAVSALAGVSRIIHAGDVGSAEVLEALSKIAPVEAIRGNVDTEAWASALPDTRTVEVESARMFILHNLADLDQAARGCGAVISGHSHRVHQEIRDGVLYLNPGSAGPRRFRLPVTVARMIVDGASIHAEIVILRV
jgi:putative phosphoesterase